MDFDSQYDLIESYLEGGMTHEQKTDFEERLLNEEKLRNALDEMKQAKDFLEEGASLFLKEKIEFLKDLNFAKTFFRMSNSAKRQFNTLRYQKAPEQ